MPLALNPKITNAGLALFPAILPPGFSVALTHISVGTGRYALDGAAAARTALAAQTAKYPCFTPGINPTPTSVQVDVVITDVDPASNSANNTWIGEIGFWAGSTLFAVWSAVSPPAGIAYKSPGVDVPIGFALNVSTLPSGSVTVSVINSVNASAYTLIEQYRVLMQSHMATVLKALCDTNRLVVENHYI